MLKDFKLFIKEYNVVTLAMAFVMGAASDSLVKSIVNDLIMPFITPLVNADSWESATFSLGPVIIRWGSFAAQLLHFLILAFIVFIIAKKILKLDKVPHK